MKQLLSLSLVAAFILSSCGAKPADATTDAAKTTVTTTTTTPPPPPVTNTPAAAASLPEQVADCMCPQIIEMAALKKEIDAAPEAEKIKLASKMSEMKEPACLKDLEAKAKALPQSERAKLEGEMKGVMEKKCGAAIKELDRK